MWTILGCFGVAVASALLPWVNAELLLLAAAAPLTSFLDLSMVVLAVTSGQVTGKAALYWMARRTPERMATGRLARTVDRWRDVSERRRSSTRLLMLLSAIVGVPPFYVTTIAAGALRIDFPSFLATAVAGRLVHFSAVAMATVAARGLGW